MKDKNDNQINNSSHNVWIEEGILFHEYQGEITLDHILENEKKSLMIIRENNVEVLPMIVTFKNGSQVSFNLHPTDYGKIITAFDLPEYISGLWIVETKEEIKKFVELINSVFHLKRVRAAKDIIAAKEEALLLLSSAETILDK